MTIEHREGGARPTLPNSRDLLVPETVGEPNGERAPNGRFAVRNGVAVGARWKHLIAESLGRDLEGEAGQLGREAYRLYRAFLGTMPCDCATVRSLVVQHARDAVLSARFTRRASELGLDTSDGREALRMAIALGARAEREAVTSLDISTRLAKAGSRGRVIDAHAEVEREFGGQS